MSWRRNSSAAFRFILRSGPIRLPYVPQAVDQLGQIADVCAREGLVYGLEIEPNLVGSTGKLMATSGPQGQPARTWC